MTSNQEQVGTNGRHQHGHEDHNSMSHNERNIAHWNQVATTYTSEKTQKDFGDLINKATAFVLSNISAIGVDFVDSSTAFEVADTSTPQRQVRVLDYACGPGTITNILAGRATEFVGLDLSPGMVEEYNRRFSSQANENGEEFNAQAYNANLFDPAGTPDSLNDPDFFDFDLVAVGFGFHHFENLQLVTQRLVERLKPGGALMVLDFFAHGPDDLPDHEAIRTISHHGFTEQQIKALFADAGLVDNEVLDFGEDVVMLKHAPRRPFMARGTKKA